MKLSRSTDGDLSTTKGGGRKAVSAGGATTGFGADYIIVDDLMKASDVTSPAQMEAAVEYYRSSLISRLNDQEQGRIIVIAQRLHEADVPGHCIETGLFHHLNLPAIAQKREEIPIGRQQIHVRELGELLFPQHQSAAVLDQMRIELGPTAFGAQYLQDPTPAESNLIRWEAIQRYDEAPERRRLQKVVQSWDTALSAELSSDYSVCTTWGFFEQRWLLLDVLRFRANYPELVDRVKSHRNRWKAELLLIEEAASGRPLIDDLNFEARTAPIAREARSWKVHAYRPRTGKVERYAAQAAKLEAGHVLFPQDAPWLEDLRKEMTGFPNRRYDDQVDSLSQFLDWTTWGRSSIALYDRGGDRSPGLARPDVGVRPR